MPIKRIGPVSGCSLRSNEGTAILTPHFEQVAHTVVVLDSQSKSKVNMLSILVNQNNTGALRTLLLRDQCYIAPLIQCANRRMMFGPVPVVPLSHPIEDDDIVHF